MQIRKCQWLSRPEKAKILSSSSIEFASTGAHALLYTFSEEGSLSLSSRSDGTVSVSLVVVNTENEGIEFKEREGLIVKHQVMAGIGTTEYHSSAYPALWTVSKEGDTLSFYADGVLLSSYSRENVKAAVSIGLKAEGKGQCAFSFIFRPKAE